MIHRFPAPAILLVSALAACADGASQAGMAEEGLDGPDRPLAWTPEHVYAVGGFDAPDWATFGTVEAVAFDGAGNLHILDRQTARVTVVSPQGQFLHTVGGLGDGPGEIGNAMGLAVTEDGRVVIPDVGKRALVVYDGAGEWIGNATVDLGAEGLPVTDVRAMPSGRVVSPNALRMQMTPGEGEAEARMTRPETRPIWSYPLVPGDSAVLVYEAWNPPPPPEGGGSTLESQTSSGGAIALRIGRVRAFEPAIHLAPLPDGRVAVVDSVAYSIKLVDPGTGITQRLERPLPPTSVTPEVEALERERRLDEIVDRGGQLRVLGGSGSFAINPDAMRRMMEDQVANMAFFPEIPVVEAIAADPLGRIWVQRSSGRPGEAGPTDLLTADGRYLGTLPPDGLRIPDAFGPGGLAAIIETDEFDVATVRVVRLPATN